jgi:branched-chain amino acid transport system permease protein
MVYLASNLSKRFERHRSALQPAAWLAAFAVLLTLPLYVSDYRLFQLGLIASTSIVAAGLVIVTGIAGQVSLAQAAFTALGAYGSTLLAQHFGLAQWIGIPVVAVAVAACGFGLGLVTLRVEGHNLALATLALTAIIQVVIVHWEALTGGALGLAVPPLTIAGKSLTSGAAQFYVVIPVSAAMFLLAANLLRSHVGRAFAALRQSEIAAQSAGVNVLYYKALAFAVSGAFGAVGGGLQALQTTYLDPQTFGILDSVGLIAIIVIGGFRSLAGAVLGSAVFTVIPAMLGAFQAYKGFVFAALLLLTIVLFPGGLVRLLFLVIAQGGSWLTKLSK